MSWTQLIVIGVVVIAADLGAVWFYAAHHQATYSYHCLANNSREFDCKLVQP
jgi:hypothetical protein